MAQPRVAAAGVPGTSEGSPIVLKGRFDITGESLADPIGSPRAKAHAARDRLNGDHAIFALVCDPELPPRLDAIEGLKDFPSRGMIRLLDAGVVPWPETGDHRFVLIYERPPGPKLLTDLDVAFEPPLPESELITRVIAPVADALEELQAIKLTHRSIRPNNMFVNQVKGGPIVLGENTSTPAAFCQPPVFESIQSLQAMPAGRGAGTIGDDIYALGISVLMLFIGHDPAEGRDAKALLQEKLDRGSFTALASRHRLPAGLREALRGMLEDRPEMRWTLDDLRSWLSDRRLKNIHHSNLDRAQRAFTLAGKSYHHPRPLAHGLATEWDKIRLEDKGHEILNWARRSIGDDVLGDAVLNAMESSDRSASDGVANPAFVARLALALDQKAPVRYRQISAHIDGFGSLLAVHYGDVEALRAITEAILEDLPGFRYRTANDDDQVQPRIMRTISGISRVLKNPTIGFGAERCLYELNLYQYCRSPLILEQKVMELNDLLPALEKVSGRSHDGPPFDRHIAAFIATHLKVELQSMLTMAGDQRDPERAALGMLGAFATLQAQAGRQAYPGLARWLGDYLGPAVESFHHRMWREKVQNELPALIERGDITALYIYLANGEARQRDRKGYAEAIAQYAKLTAEISFLKSYGFNDPARTREYGYQISAGLTGLISFAAVIFSFFLMW